MLLNVNFRTSCGTRATAPCLSSSLRRKGRSSAFSTRVFLFAGRLRSAGDLAEAIPPLAVLVFRWLMLLVASIVGSSSRSAGQCVCESDQETCPLTMIPSQHFDVESFLWLVPLQIGPLLQFIPWKDSKYSGSHIRGSKVHGFWLACSMEPGEAMASNLRAAASALRSASWLSFVLGSSKRHTLSLAQKSEFKASLRALLGPLGYDLEGLV